MIRSKRSSSLSWKASEPIRRIRAEYLVCIQPGELSVVWVYHNKGRENELDLKVGLPVGGSLWEMPRHHDSNGELQALEAEKKVDVPKHGIFRGIPA